MGHELHQPLLGGLGPRDLAADQAVMVPRDTGGKTTLPLAGLAKAVTAELGAIHARLLEAAERRLATNVVDVSTWEDVAERVAENAGWNRVWWAGSAKDEARLKAETKATIRCIPFAQSGERGRCIATGQETATQVIVARAY